MAQAVLYIVFAAVAAAFYFIAISEDGWGCGGTLLLDKKCNSETLFLVTGVVFLIAGLFICFGAVVLTLHLIFRRKLLSYIAVILSLISTFVGAAGEIYYVGSMELWPPVLIAAGVSLTIILSAFMVNDLTKGG